MVSNACAIGTKLTVPIRALEHAHPSPFNSPLDHYNHIQDLVSQAIVSTPLNRYNHPLYSA